MRLLVITNIPTPYRVDFFNTLHSVLKENNSQLKVLFCARTEPNRHWDIDFHKILFEYKILNGFHLNFKNLFLHFNLSVLRESKAFKPNFILYAGSWNMPTVVLNLVYGRVFKAKWKSVFWSEGHEGAVLHKKGIVPTIRKSVLNLFDGFAVPNKRSEKYLFDFLKINKKPIIILPNTVDGAFYTKPKDWNESDTRDVKRKFNLPESTKQYIQVAQVDDRKSARELVLYWDKLDMRIKSNSVLILVGEGDLRKELQEYIQINKIENVFLLGHQSKDNVRKLLFASDCFILLTKNDPNPLTLIEASYAGLPIITTRFAGNCNELVFEGENGFVLDEIEFQSFSNAVKILNTLLNNGNAFEVSTQNAIRNFDVFNVATSLVEQFQSSFTYEKKAHK